MVVNKEENGCTEERKLDAHVTCMINSCQGKVAGAVF